MPDLYGGSCTIRTSPLSTTTPDTLGSSMVPSSALYTKTTATFENRTSSLASVTRKPITHKRNNILPLVPATKEPETLTLSSDDEKEDKSDNHRGTGNKQYQAMHWVWGCMCLLSNLCDVSLILYLLSAILFFHYLLLLCRHHIYSISKFS